MPVGMCVPEPVTVPVMGTMLVEDRAVMMRLTVVRGFTVVAITYDEMVAGRVGALTVVGRVPVLMRLVVVAMPAVLERTTGPGPVLTGIRDPEDGRLALPVLMGLVVVVMRRLLVVVGLRPGLVVTETKGPAEDGTAELTSGEA